MVANRDFTPSTPADMAVATLSHTIEDLLFNPQNPTQDILDLRLQVARQGLGEEDDDTSSVADRLYTWLILLNARPTSYDQYSTILERGASPAYDKIKADVHRTFTSDPQFQKRVSHGALTRLLNTIAWFLHDKYTAEAEETPLPPSPTLDPQLDESEQGRPSPALDAIGDGSSSTNLASGRPSSAPDALARDGGDLYYQGMNVLAAPLLFIARSEPAAYSMMRSLLHDQMPTYFTPGLKGIHYGTALVLESLSVVDPEVRARFAGDELQIWVFASVMTLCASIPPLSEVLRLWDFLLATGPHVVVLCAVATVLERREALMAAPKPMTVLGRAPTKLDARRVIEVVRDRIAPVVFGGQHGDLAERIITHARVLPILPPPGLHPEAQSQ